MADLRDLPLFNARQPAKLSYSLFPRHEQVAVAARAPNRPCPTGLTDPYCMHDETSKVTKQPMICARLPDQVPLIQLTISHTSQSEQNPDTVLHNKSLTHHHVSPLSPTQRSHPISSPSMCS